MNPIARAVLAICIRWIHISSVVALIGGFLFARVALAPVLRGLPAAERRTAGTRAVASFRPVIYTVLVTILGSGIYNYVAGLPHRAVYQAWFGLKLLFVLHIFAVAILYAKRDVDESKRERWTAGIVVSGLIVIGISAYLRWISIT